MLWQHLALLLLLEVVLLPCMPPAVTVGMGSLGSAAAVVAALRRYCSPSSVSLTGQRQQQQARKHLHCLLTQLQLHQLGPVDQTCLQQSQAWRSHALQLHSMQVNNCQASYSSNSNTINNNSCSSMKSPLASGAVVAERRTHHHTAAQLGPVPVVQLQAAMLSGPHPH
jgi:hypothetical protein